MPSGTQYQLVAVAGYDGRRYWVPIGGSLQLGAITIFDEGTPVSSASSITQLNFVGAAVTAQVSCQNPSGHPGIAATVTVIPVTVGENPPIHLHQIMVNYGGRVILVIYMFIIMMVTQHNG